MSKYQFISPSTRNGALIVSILPHELRDLETSQAVKRELAEAVTAPGVNHVVLDLTNVDSIGSVGLLAFLSLRRVPGVERIVLCNLGANAKEVFMLCRLIADEPNPVLPFEYAASVDDAIALLQQS